MKTRHLIPVESENDDMDTGDTERSAAKTGGRTGGHHTETPVSDIPVSLTSPFPKTLQLHMPYHKAFSDTLDTATPGTAVVYKNFRLNSIYDVFPNSGLDYYAEASGTSAPTPDSYVAGSMECPMWRTYCNNFYWYWHVVRCNWNIRVRCANLATFKITNGLEFDVFVYFHGRQGPPVTYIAKEYRLLHPHMIYRKLKIPPVSLTQVASLDNDSNYWVTIAGSTSDKDVQHEVYEDELKQTWHRQTEVPPDPEICSIVVQMNPDYSLAGSTNAVPIHIDFSLDYITQWKDLKFQYEYITADSDISITDAAKQEG